jgi:hypothetical protein
MVSFFGCLLQIIIPTNKVHHGAPTEDSKNEDTRVLAQEVNICKTSSTYYVIFKFNREQEQIMSYPTQTCERGPAQGWA